MDVLLVYVGLLVIFIGFVSIIKPLIFLRISKRRTGVTLFFFGLVVGILGATLPLHLTRPAKSDMRIDDFLPAFHAHEVHSIRVHARPDRVFRAIKAVTLPEIRFVRVLFWIRSLPAHLLGKGQPRAPSEETEPIVDVITRSDFILLAHESDRELVFGTVGQFWKPTGTGSPPKITDSKEFLALDSPGYAKAVLNFYIDDEGGGWCRVTTETRIFATDPSTRRRFAAYWRVIYPGSALLRRTWLYAIKRRAEHNTKEEVLSQPNNTLESEIFPQV